MARAPVGSLLKASTPPKGTPDAEAIAIAALLFIAEDETLLSRFAAASGLALDRLRESAADPAFLGGVLDLVLADEALLLAVAEAQDLSPSAVAAARTRLPGG